MKLNFKRAHILIKHSINVLFKNYTHIGSIKESNSTLNNNKMGSNARDFCSQFFSGIFLFCFVVAICDLVYNMETIDDLF